MSAVFPLLEEADAFRPVRVAGRPVFRQDCAEYAMFYAPGCLCVVDLPGAEWFEATIAPRKNRLESEPSARPELVLSRGEGQSRRKEQNQDLDWGAELWRRAELAVAEASRWQEEPFRPECLTLYLNNECNLSCVYCHTDPSPRPVARLELEAIAAAAEVVAENCRRKGRPFYIVFHGGGEPTLHRERVDRAMARLEAVASAHSVEPFRYVATNGVMPEEKAVWLTRRFDLVGLSCDGPADIQNSQRPRWGGGGTSHTLERTAHILRQEGCRLHVRTTITGATLHRQAEIADYICQQFSPEEIHFEPVYLGGRTGAATGLTAQQAGEFVTHFLEAREIARKHDILLITSGSRPGSIHGPYCHVFRSVLNLVPGGVATACFKVTNAAQVREKGAVIGAPNGETGRFEIDHLRVQELCQQLDTLPPACAGCFNRYHCVRECPDHCALDDDTPQSRDSSVPGFRCRVQKALAYTTLREVAEALWSEALARKAEGVKGSVYGEFCRTVCGTAIL
jgi:sulfatase maturation enzyme AslB (radical SAM superfamily)